MKKVLLSVLFLATMSMSAQETEFESPFSKGNVTIGGSLSVGKSEVENSVNSDNTENKSFSLNPSVGYFIVDNLVVGLLGGYNKVKSTENSNVEYEDDNYSIGAYVEKYYKVYKSFYLSVSGNFRYANNDYKENNIKSRFYILGVSPNISCVLNKHMSIKVGFDNIIGYTYRTFENQGVSNNNSSVFSTNLGDSDLTVGFRYFF